MNDVVKAAIVISIGMIVATWLNAYLSPFHSCVRAVMTQQKTEFEAAGYCARWLGGEVNVSQ